MPSFSRHSDTDTSDERPTAAGGGNTTPVREGTGSRAASPDDTTRFTTAGAAADRADAKADRADARASRTDAKAERAATTDQAPGIRTDEHPREGLGPKPRASLLATLGLILAVASVLLVLSGPLLGYGIGVAVLALILSLSGISATGKRHVAGKTDALIGTALSLAAIVVGVLALTGSLAWLGTDMQPVTSVRDWLDTQIVDRF